MSDNVQIITGPELDALLRRRAASKLDLKKSEALNGSPENYHHAQWWYEELLVDDMRPAQRHLAAMEAEGIAKAMMGTDLTDRASACTSKPKK